MNRGQCCGLAERPARECLPWRDATAGWYVSRPPRKRRNGALWQQRPRWRQALRRGLSSRKSPYAREEAQRSAAATTSMLLGALREAASWRPQQQAPDGPHGHSRDQRNSPADHEHDELERRRPEVPSLPARGKALRRIISPTTPPAVDALDDSTVKAAMTYTPRVPPRASRRVQQTA